MVVRNTDRWIMKWKEGHAALWMVFRKCITVSTCLNADWVKYSLNLCDILLGFDTWNIFSFPFILQFFRCCISPNTSIWDGYTMQYDNNVWCKIYFCFNFCLFGNFLKLLYIPEYFYILYWVGMSIVSVARELHSGISATV